MRIQRATLVALLACAASCLQSSLAFAPITQNSQNKISTSITNRDLSLSAAPPIISNWKYDSKKGTIIGRVKNHPTIPDGDRITTSSLVTNPSSINANVLVQTKSGSKYKLSNVAPGGVIPAVEEKKLKQKEADEKKAKIAAEKAAAAAEKKRLADEKKKAQAASAKKQSVAAPKKIPSIKVQKPKPVAKPKAVVAAKKATPPPPSPVVASPKVDNAALQKLAKTKFALTGTTVGPKGKYLLAGKPSQSSGRDAKIWTAYLANPNIPDVPAGFENGDESKVQKLTIKLSPDTDRLELESTNYNKVQSGLFSGRFVRKIDYIKYVTSNKRDLDGKVSALVIESGVYDLKALLSARKGLPIRGRALRDAASSAGQCIQAVHSSNLVWTDLKTENFIVVNNDNFFKEVSDMKGSMGLPGVKGIDLESVIVKGGNPIDYSPEACPPEFAKAFIGGYGEDFILEYSYDIWSLGMMLYELSTGVPYFGKKGASVVTKELCQDTFEIDVSAVPDAKLRDLIGNCLNLDPKKRPDITGFLLHPYFLTSGIGPFGF